MNTIVTVETRCSHYCLLLVSRFKVVVSFGESNLRHPFEAGLKLK